MAKTSTPTADAKHYATGTIYLNGVRAFNAGDEVPADHVAAYDLGQQTTTDESSARPSVDEAAAAPAEVLAVPATDPGE